MNQATLGKYQAFNFPPQSDLLKSCKSETGGSTNKYAAINCTQLSLAFITFCHHCQASHSSITKIYLKRPCLPAMLHQLKIQQLSWSVKSCQLCGTEIRWGTEQLSVGITKMGLQLFLLFVWHPLLKILKLSNISHKEPTTKPMTFPKFNSLCSILPISPAGVFPSF